MEGSAHDTLSIPLLGLPLAGSFPRLLTRSIYSHFQASRSVRPDNLAQGGLSDYRPSRQVFRMLQVYTRCICR